MRWGTAVRAWERAVLHLIDADCNHASFKEKIECVDCIIVH